MVKINWKPKETISRFASNFGLSDTEFLNIFFKKKKIQINSDINILQKLDSNMFENSDIKDNIYFCCSKWFYGYCPLYKKYLYFQSFCHECNYLNKNYDGCIERFGKILNKNIDKIIDIKKDKDGRLLFIKVLENDLETTYSFESLPYNTGTIIQLWNNHKVEKVARFMNIGNGQKVQITKNPNEMIRKYKKIYGKICSESDGYNDYSKKSLEIFGWNKDKWVIIWNR